MPIKIHHGPPGSYKTAGAMADDFLREAKKGRVIVTNVRGVSADRTFQRFPDLPETFDVIFVDDKTEEGRHKLATWFHWVPKGAFLLIDEVQDIWPKRWRDSDLRALDYPGGLTQATKDDRPFCWEQALDKHRHFNWDMTLTCPAYAKVRDDVKSIADMAYKHKDLGLLGIGGRYVEAAHAADDSGKSASDFVNIVTKKVPKYVFDLYDSTQTGLFSKTASGFNLFKSPRVAILLLVLLGATYFGLSHPMPRVLGGAGPALAVGSSSASAHGSAPNVVRSGSAGAVVPGDTGSRPDAQSLEVIQAFQAADLVLSGSYSVGGRQRYFLTANGAEISQQDLLDLGFSVKTLGRCGLEIRQGEWRKVVLCNAVPAATTTKVVDAPVVPSKPVQAPDLPQS